jgi:hypothetical protein
MATRQGSKAVGDTVPTASTGVVSESVAETPVVVDTVVLGNVMKVAVSRSFKINMGNYESADTFVSATIDVPVDTDLEALSAQFSDVIDTLQAPDLELFKSLTTVPAPDAKTKQAGSIAHRLI